MLHLKQLTAHDGPEVYDMLQGIESNDHGFRNPVKDMPCEQFPHWLRQNAGYARGVGLEDWMVPATAYWLYDGGTPVGFGKLRHRLNDALLENGGHIGYAVSALHRGRGCGNELLRLLLLEARALGIPEALITVDKANVRSNRVVVSNGGRLARETAEKNYYLVNLSGDRL